MPVNDFVICAPTAFEHGDCNEYVVAKAPPPFDDPARAAGKLALPKGARIVANPFDAQSIKLDGETRFVIRARDMIGVVTRKPDAAPATAPIAPVIDLAAERAKRIEAEKLANLVVYARWLQAELAAMKPAAHTLD